MSVPTQCEICGRKVRRSEHAKPDSDWFRLCQPCETAKDTYTMLMAAIDEIMRMKWRAHYDKKVPMEYGDWLKKLREYKSNESLF